MEAEAQLRASEEKYRSLFESIDEGFIVLQLLYNGSGKAIDYVHLEVNSAYDGYIGLPDIVGKRIGELVPDPSDWAEIYDRVAQSGESNRFEKYESSLDIWFDIHASRIGGVGSSLVAVLFRDITDRKRREANLTILAEIAVDFVRLTSEETLRQGIGERLASHLRLDGFNFADVNEGDETVTVKYTWSAADATNLQTTDRIADYMTADFAHAMRSSQVWVVHDSQRDERVDTAALAAIGVGAYLVIPYHSYGEWQGCLTVTCRLAREWMADEIAFVSEVSNRIFPRLERARTEKAVAANLRDTQLLRELGARLVCEGDVQTLYQEIMAAAIALTHADAGTVQILDDATQDLLLLDSEGFDRTITEHFYRVNVSSNTSCGAALRAGVRSFIDFDVPESEDPDGSLRMHVEAGYLSAQSTPLIARSGKEIGMMSTHWHEHHRPCDRQLRLLDLLARQAADLIDRRRAEAALRESEAKLRFMLDASQIGEWDLDLTTQPHTAHRSLIHDRIFGYETPLPEWSYEMFLNHVHPDDRAAVDEQFQQVLSASATIDWNFECRIIRNDRSVRWIWVRSSVYCDSHGTPTRLLGMVVDFTDRKQAEIDLADRNQELDSFVYVVSHDIKAPLRGISNLSQWIEEDLGTGLAAGVQQQMAQLRDRVKRIESMIDGLLQYARVGRTDAQIQLVCVAELLAETIDSIAPPATFEIIIAPDLPTFHTKRLMLSQVFANLISNAFKHHDKSDGSIRISCQSRGDLYEFAVSDDGPGIPPEQHDRVFVIFHAPNPQKNLDSTGIGLSIVKKVVETAGGHIWLESLGRGTTFYFTWSKQ